LNVTAEMEEEAIIQQLGKPITKLFTTWASNPDVNLQALEKRRMFPLWVCQECKLGFSSLNLIKVNTLNIFFSSFVSKVR